ncbi:MAG: site-2 protease family protein [Anaerolineales bacterium]|nr:site-2 protease family protein [Anaerolineales bacterium]
MKCDRCGLQSDVEQAFSTEKRLFRKSKHFCPDCTVRRQTRSFIWDAAILAGLGVLIFALSPSSGLAAIILAANLILLSMIPLVIIHELAHAGAAKLAGMHVFGIVVGIGKTIWSGKFLGMDWVINILPIAGITGVGVRPVPHVRWKLFFVYLAGPASHVLMALGLTVLWVVLWLTLPLSTLGHRFFSSLIIANILLAAVSLFPYKAFTVAGMQGSDGWQLLHVPFLKDSELTKRYVGYYVGEAAQSYAANDFDKAKKWVDKALTVDASSGIARNVLGMIQMACGEHLISRETFLRLLETEEAKEPALHYTLFNNVAYLDALLHDPSLLSEADQLSAEALKHLPWVPAVVGTRGTVLVELGQLDEGIALLKKSMSLHADKQGKAANACHVAIGELRRGDPDAARKYLASAKALDPKCLLIPDVEAQMETKTIDHGR